jgi:mono/diheme cytochrome c family protein
VLGLAAVAVPLLLSPAAAAKTHATTINVTLTPTAIKLSKKSVPAAANARDLVTFKVKNGGKQKQDFKIGNKLTPLLAPGKTASIKVLFAKAGKFPYQSTVSGKTKKVIKGTFTVTANTAVGKAVYDLAGCGTCHVLKAAGSVGTVGPNLDTSKKALSQIVNLVTNGKGTMPAQAGVLSAKQIQDVANFVYTSRTG